MLSGKVVVVLIAILALAASGKYFEHNYFDHLSSGTVAVLLI